MRDREFRGRSRERETRRRPRPIGEPIPATRSALEEILTFVRHVYEQGLGVEQAAVEFFQRYPDLLNVFIGLGAAAILVLLADNATIIGILNDVLGYIIGVMEWVALRLLFF